MSIAVIGSGIAGAAACIALAEAGHTPLWIAPESDEGRCPIGETLAAAAGPILAALGLNEILACPPHRPSHAVFMAWGGQLAERNSAIHLEGPGWVLDRFRFDAELRSAARGRAERILGMVRRAEPAGSAWRLVLDDGQHCHADFLIDATGRASRFARNHAAYDRLDRQVAVTAVLRQADLSVVPTPATLIEAVPAGWWYAALLPRGQLSLAYFSDPDLLPDRLSSDPAIFRLLCAETEYVARWIADAGFEPPGEIRLASAGTARLAEAAGVTESGAGWAAAGDAAAAFDPLSSHGMTTALWTGVRAAEAAAAWQSGQREPLASYASAVRQGYEAFCAQRCAIYGRERRYAANTFWHRRLAHPKDQAGPR